MNLLEFLEVLPPDVRAREVAKLPPHLLRGVPARLLATARAPRQRRAGARSSAPTTSSSDLTEPQDAGELLEPLVLTVPMPPIVANRAHGSSRHWSVIDGERRAYVEQLDLIASFSPNVCWASAQECYVIPLPPPAPLRRVTVTSAMVLRGAMDDDGAVSRHKWTIDWLVDRGYLASDRRSCVRWGAFPTQRVTRKVPASITLTLSPRDTP